MSLVLVALSLTANATPQAPLRLLGVDYLGDLPTLVAAEKHLFRRHGLDVEVAYRASGKQGLQALRAGEADIALMATTPLVLELLESPPTGGANDPLIIASLVYSSRLNHVVALGTHDIRVPSDLDGRRIGLMGGTNAEYLWWLFSFLHRLDPDATRVVDLPIAALPEALVEGRIDAAVLWEPWTSRLTSRVGGDLVQLPGSEIYVENWVLVARRGLLQQQPGAIHDLLAVYREAIAFIETSPGDALNRYIDHAKLDEEGAVTEQDLPLFGLSLNWSLLTSLMETIEYARETGQVDRGAPPVPLAWIESRPLREVMPIAVSIPALPQHPRVASP